MIGARQGNWRKKWLLHWFTNNTNLSADVDEIVHPIVVDGVDGVSVVGVTTLPDINTDALVNVAVPDPAVLVHDPHDGPLMQYLRKV